MNELVTQVSYLGPVKQRSGEFVDEVVATFSCPNPVCDFPTWSAKIKKVSLKTAAEVIFTFFNSQHATNASLLEVSINGQKIYLSKYNAAQTADYYLSSLASDLKLE